MDRPPGCLMCAGERLAVTSPGFLVVGPSVPVCELDVWIAPEGHIASVDALTAATVERWWAGVRLVARAWRSNTGCDGIHGMGFVGSLRPDWPIHLALRVIGRRPSEAFNPMDVFNGREQPRPVDVDARARALVTPAGESPAPSRWELSERDRLQRCMSCSPENIDRSEIAVTATSRLLQHGAAVGPGMLVMSPIRHTERFEDLQPDEFGGLLAMAHKANGLFGRQMGAGGTYFSFNDGRSAGQETPHVHVHLWARNRASQRTRSPTAYQR